MVAVFTITETNAIVGQVINFTGAGFHADEAIDLTFNAAPITPTSPVVADSNGDFTGTLTIPAVVNGTSTIAATDQSAGSDDDTIDIDAHIEISPSTGIVGDTVTITGTGFATESALTVDFDGADITPSGSPTSDTVGGFEIDVVITDDVAGVHPLTVTDASMNDDADNFTLTGSIVLVPESGRPEAEFKVLGHGFNDGDSVAFTFDGDVISPLVAVTVDSDGTFEAVLVVPNGSETGTVTIAAEDDTMETASATFTILPIEANDLIKNGPVANRKLVSASIVPEEVVLESTDYEAIVIVNTRNFDRFLAQIVNTDSANTGTFNLFGSLSHVDTNPPAFDEESWVPILTEIDVVKETSKSLYTEHPYVWIAVAGKKKTANSVSCAVYARGVTLTPNS